MEVYVEGEHVGGAAMPALKGKAIELAFELTMLTLDGPLRCARGVVPNGDLQPCHATCRKLPGYAWF